MTNTDQNPNRLTEEEMAMGLNVDDNIAGTQNLEEGTFQNGDSEGDEAAKLRQEVAEARDKYVRLMAEFDNYKKRQARENTDLRQTAGREIISSLLDVVDDSDRALRTIEAGNDVEAIKEGVTLVFQKLKNTLQQKGLKAMEAHHQPFDPEVHEAITEIPAPGKEHIGKVLDVVQPGYYLNDKLIRHAKVVVGK